MSENESSPGTPTTQDSLSLENKPVLGIGTSPGAVRLNNFVKAMSEVGEDADEKYKAALEELRQNSEVVLAAIAQASGACRAHDYSLRWALVYAARQMRHSAALPYLRNLVLTPIPPEESRSPHSFSTAGKETVLRTTAVEGVGALAVQGEERAVNALFEFLSIPSISIRRSSVQALLAIDKGWRDKIAEHLPKDAHYLLDIVAKDVREVPQVKDPRRHLRKRDPQVSEIPSPPDFDGGRPDGSRGGERGPKLGG